MASLKYWLWLKMREHLTPAKTFLLLERFGEPDDIFLRGREDYETIQGLPEAAIESLCDKSLDAAERVLEECAKQEITVISMQDANYPERLRQIYHPPILLFARGHLPDMDDEVAIAFVGTRKCSAYGIRVTDQIAAEIAAAGGLIVSGMALGIDAAAHSAALREGAKTVAVLGCGVDICYPRQNRRLMHEIIENGAVISEYIPGTAPDRQNFPARNRILSGISLGVLVAEAPERSGALITATLAAEQGRDVFAIPGDISNLCSRGANRLIADGAKLVLSGEDVLNEYRNEFARKIRTPDPIARRVAAQHRMEEQSSALEAMLSRYRPEEQSVLRAIGTECRHVDEIIAESGVPAPYVLSLLTVLEISGVVEQSAGKHFKLIMKA